MSASIVVAGENVWMSTGAAEVVRLGLAAWLRAEHAPSAERDRIIEALELRWPADLFDTLAPYDEPAVRAWLGPGWLALARDVARERPMWIGDVDWAGLDRPMRIWWISVLLRIARAWTGIDLATELTDGWSDEDTLRLALFVAESDVSRAYHAYCDAPSLGGRAAVEAAFVRKEKIAAAIGPDAVAGVADERARTLERMNEIAARR